MLIPFLQENKDKLSEAVVESDTSTASMQFVIDEGSMVSNSPTKVPTQQSVKTYVDNAVTANLQYKGGYDAATNTPNLETPPTGVMVGWFYTVTVAGTFFTTPVQVGDALIAEANDPTVEGDWTILNRGLDAATIKVLYESNPDTNAFNDAADIKLGDIQSGAEVNNISDVDATDLTDGGETTLHTHPDSGGSYVLATYGANLQNTGRYPAINGVANGPEISGLGINASAVAPAGGTIDALTYYMDTGDNTTVFKIIKNGVVAHTFTCVGPYGVETDIGVPTAVGDNVAIKFDAGMKPAGSFYSIYIK